MLGMIHVPPNVYYTLILAKRPRNTVASLFHIAKVLLLYIIQLHQIILAEYKMQKLTAPGIPKPSPIQVLTGPNVA